MEPARTVTLDDVEVDRAVLDAAGGPLPATWAGQPVLRIAEPPLGGRGDDVPTTGWRVIDDRTRPGHVVLASPAHGDLPRSRGPARWWLLHLDRTEGGWQGQVACPEPERAAQVDRMAGVRLDWPTPPLDLAAAEVVDLHVRIGRYADDGSRLPLAWDPEDGTYVVAHVLDATSGRPLEHQAHQAFAGLGPTPVLDAHGEAWLPVRWTTYDVGGLAPGDYRVRAQLVALPVHTPVVPVRVRAGPPPTDRPG